jgi:hypothetical protein
MGGSPVPMDSLDLGRSQVSGHYLMGFVLVSCKDIACHVQTASAQPIISKRASDFPSRPNWETKFHQAKR